MCCLNASVHACELVHVCACMYAYVCVMPVFVRMCKYMCVHKHPHMYATISFADWNVLKSEHVGPISNSVHMIIASIDSQFAGIYECVQVRERMSFHINHLVASMFFTLFVYCLCICAHFSCIWAFGNVRLRV